MPKPTPRRCIMPIENIPDWDKRMERHEAFWEREILDRPVVRIIVPAPRPRHPWPTKKKWPSHRDRWMDAEYIAELSLAAVMNADYYGDALPAVWVDLGPELFSAFFGMEMEYGERTSWSIPNLHDWKDAGKLRLSFDNAYWRKMMEITDACLAIGKGKFYTGITDLHPGGDAIAAFRDPLNLNLDMIEHPAEVKALLRTVTDAFKSVFDAICEKLESAEQAITTWTLIVSRRRSYVPSNDFSCMISKAMFDDFFLPGIVEECRHLEASIYHLDGPGALRHLDSLLAIEELDAIQWIYGAGHGRASDWLDVYRKCQAAGKGLQMTLEPDEIDLFMQALKPEGLWLTIANVRNAGEAEALLRKIARWR